MGYPLFPRLRPRLAAAFLVVVPTLASGLPGQANTVDRAPDGASPLPVSALYGDRIEFDIFRSGARVGSHRVSFTEREDGLSVTTDFDLEIGALFITFFELQYRSEALWRDGQLVWLSARTNRNGDVSTVDVRNRQGSLTVEGPNGFYEAALGIYPTNHWNAGVIRSTQLVNTITGRVNDVRLVARGTEQVQTDRGLVEATRYQYDGAIQNEVWYDSEGRWVAMQFPGDDGSLIELRCNKCFPGKTAGRGDE